MRLIRNFCLLAACLIGAFASGPFTKAARAEETKIQGVYVALQIGQISFFSIDELEHIIADIAHDTTTVFYRAWADTMPVPEGTDFVVLEGTELRARRPSRNELALLTSLTRTAGQFHMAAVGKRFALVAGIDGENFVDLYRPGELPSALVLEKQGKRKWETYIRFDSLADHAHVVDEGVAVNLMLLPFAATSEDANLEILPDDSYPLYNRETKKQDRTNPVGVGKRAYNILKCWTCHRVNGKGGILGPDLTHAGERMPSIAWHIQHLKKPESLAPWTVMPSVASVDKEILKGLARAMVTLK